jgi:hypothetical protein
MARHHKIEVEEDPSTRADVRKIHVVDTKPTFHPLVRGARRRSVLRDTLRHTTMKTLGIGRAPEPEPEPEPVPVPVELTLKDPQPPQSPFNRRRDGEEAQVLAEAEVADSPHPTDDAGPVGEAEIGIADFGIGTAPGVEGEPGIPTPLHPDDGDPNDPNVFRRPPAAPTKKLTQAERQALLADAHAKKDAKKAKSPSTKSATGKKK